MSNPDGVLTDFSAPPTEEEAQAECDLRYKRLQRDIKEFSSPEAALGQPPKVTAMSKLYDELIDVRVRLKDGRTGIVRGVDPRPRMSIDDKSTPPGDWLYIKLDRPGQNYTDPRVVYTLAADVRRVD